MTNGEQVFSILIIYLLCLLAGGVQYRIDLARYLKEVNQGIKDSDQPAITLARAVRAKPSAQVYNLVTHAVALILWLLVLTV